MRFYLVLLFVISTQLIYAQTKTEENEMTKPLHIGAGCIDYEPKSEAEREIEKRAFLGWKYRRSSGLRASSSVRTIPIVFHLIEDVPGLTDNNIKAAVASLNNAFSHSNRYPGGQNFGGDTIGVDTRIEFCLPSRAPDGGRTNGIVRWSSDYHVMDQDIEDAKLKTMGQWDPRYYLNVYVVDTIKSESSASYTGRTGWTRESIGGYASLPTGIIGEDALTDGVVVSGTGVGLLAHEIGHYLGLFHTFMGGCRNNDCLVDGDMVCDTPPISEASEGSCNMGQNTCKSDTLSNYSNGIFRTNVTDMVTNFMDYSSCPRDFSQGQADRMLFHLDTYRIDLAPAAPNVNEACIAPCSDSIDVRFTVSERYIATNTPITFDATAVGIDTYEWYVERLGGTGFDYTMTWKKGYAPTTAVAGTSPSFTTSMVDPGKYRIYLKAWNSANPSCYASYSRVLRVTCGGVDARFYPDARFIASKRDAGKMLDNVIFTNLSAQATSYEWTVDHFPYDSQLPALTTFKSNVEDLDHTFLEPGDFEISLYANDGVCADTIGPFLLPVVDPTIDPGMKINNTECYKEDSIIFNFQLWNGGYDTMRIGFPISFYDEDPRQASPVPKKLGTFYTDKLVYGRDSRENFTFIIPASRNKLDRFYAVMNDTGAVSFPITWPLDDENVISVNSEFPPSGYNELKYDNNVNNKRDYQFRISLEIDGTIGCMDQEVNLVADFEKTRFLTDITWVPDTRVSCKDCLDPSVQLPDNDTTMQGVILTSRYFCKDTLAILLPEVGTVVGRPAVTSIPELCPGESPLDLSSFVSGADLTWYSGANSNDANKSTPSMDTNTPGTYSVFVTQTIDNCEGPRQELKYTIKSAPTEPTINNNPILCIGSNAPDISTLVAGNNIQWYDVSSGGTALASPPVINTGTAGQSNFWLSQSANGCESPRASLPIEVRDKSAVPQVNNTPSVCPGTTAPDLGALVTGTDLLWYSSENGGSGNVQAPMASTQNPGTFTHWVSQNTNTCESPRVEVSYVVVDVTSPPQVNAVADICVGTAAPDLAQAAGGSNLLWYDMDTGGTGSATPPNLNTQQAGDFSFWVSQSAAGCESQRSQVTVRVNALPNEPTLQGDPRFCQNSPAPQLGNFVTGSSLTWYAGANDTLGVDTIPVISTDQSGTNSFWISQKVNGCEGPRIELSYEVSALPGAPHIVNTPSLCPGDANPDLGSLVTGTDLLWYTSDNGGVGDVQIPMSNTQTPGTYSHWVSQTVNTCEGPRVEVSYVVVDVTSPPQVNAVADICVGAVAPDLSQAAGGSNLLWYNSDTSTISSATPPNLNTQQAGDFSFWVSQSAAGCESQRSQVTVRVNALPSEPTLQGDPRFCQNSPAPQLGNFVAGSSLTWYAGANDTLGVDTIPVISTNQAGTNSFWISQMANGCEGPRIELSYEVSALPGAPQIVNTPSLCPGDANPDLGSLVTGTDLLWYTSDNGGVGEVQAPMSNTQTPGSYSHWVSQTVNTCEGPRVEVSYVVVDVTSPPQVNAVADICEGAVAPDLSQATGGSNLLWYDTDTGGTGSATPPNLNTQQAGNFSFWVSQTATGCESQRSEITIQIKPLPDQPNLQGDTRFCENSNAPILSDFVTGNNLTWYASNNDTAGTAAVPVISTAQVGVNSFWVSQTENACEGEKIELSYEIIALPGIPQVSDTLSLCPGASAPDLGTLVSGADLLWYNTQNGGSGDTQVPLVSTQNLGITTHWVSQTVNTCEGPRVALSYEVLTPPPPPTIDLISAICAGDPAPNLADAVQENNLLWYDSISGGQGTDITPTPNTLSAGDLQFWVSQMSTCESDRASVELRIKPLPSLPNLQGDPQFCKNSESPQLGDFITGDNLTWYDLQSDSIGNNSVPTIETNQVGINSFWVSQTLDGCEGAKVEISYEILELPLSPAIDPIDAVCQDAAAPDWSDYVSGSDILWYPNEAASIGNPQAPVVSTQSVGEFSVWVSQSDANCISPRVELSFEVLSPPQSPGITPVEDLCEGDDPIDLAQKVQGDNLKWYAQENDTIGQISTPLVSTIDDGRFQWWVSQSDENCESQKVVLNYRIKRTPEAPMVVDEPSICKGEMVPDLSNFINGLNLKWYQEEASSNASIRPPIINSDTSGAYTFWVSQTWEGCEGPKNVLDVKVIGLELIPYGPYLVPEGSTEQIEVEVLIDPIEIPYQISWVDPRGVPIGDDSNVIDITPKEDGFYRVLLEAGTCSIRDRVEVEILYELDITRVFSPNDDGANDFWYIGDILEFPNAEVNVFNRWGDMIYQARPYRNDWDGTDSRGRKLPMGTYYFVIELNDNGRKPVTGSITIKH